MQMLPGGWAWFVYEVLGPAVSTLMTVDLRHNTARIKSRTGMKDRIEVSHKTFKLGARAYLGRAWRSLLFRGVAVTRVASGE